MQAVGHHGHFRFMLFLFLLLSPLSWTMLIKFRVMPWRNRSSLPYFFFFIFFSPPIRLARWLHWNRKKKERFHRCREWPCYRAKSRELLNSRLHFYFRIDREKMEADLNLFSRRRLLLLSLDNRTQREREEFFLLFAFSLVLIHFFFSSLLYPNGGHFVIVQTFIHWISFVFQTEPEDTQSSNFSMETSISKVFFLIVYLSSYPMDISSMLMMSNDPFDIRFVSYNGMYMWESTPFVFFFFLSVLRDRLNQQLNSHTDKSIPEISSIQTRVMIIVQRNQTVEQY